MTLEIALLFGMIAVMVVLLVRETLPPDTVALLVMVGLMLFGFVTPQEGISGLGNQATITVLALMILSVGLETTGVITRMGQALEGLFAQRPWQTVLLLMLIVGTCSAFISTTAVVIVFMRIVIKQARKLPTSLSRILMPLSFAGILGGSCTLLGTSTNLLVSAISEDYAMAPFGVFEFSRIGLIFFGVAVGYMILAGRHLIPERKQPTDSLTRDYRIQHYFAELKILPDSRFEGKRIQETDLFRDDEIDLVQITRPEEAPHFPSEEETLHAGDTLLVKGEIGRITRLLKRGGLSHIIQPPIDAQGELKLDDSILCEVLIRPQSRLVGRLLDKVAIKRDYDAIPLAIHKHRELITTNLREVKIEAGDTVLMAVGKTNFERFYNSSEFVVLQDHHDLASSSNKAPVAVAIMVLVIALAAAGVVSILVSALAGCAAMIVTGCFDLQKAYRRVDWGVVFLLAGVIPLGIAMDNTGASDLIGQTFVDNFSHVSPRVIVSVLFIGTALLSGIISNNATAVLLAPIAFSIGTGLGLDPRPLLLTVMFGANMSFMSPIGYQTNMLIYGPGNYRFGDFVKVGGGLTLLLWAVATWLIPWAYFGI